MLLITYSHTVFSVALPYFDLIHFNMGDLLDKRRCMKRLHFSLRRERLSGGYSCHVANLIIAGRTELRSKTD